MSSKRKTDASAHHGWVRSQLRLALLLTVFWLTLVSRGDAQTVRVPASVQAALIAKVAGFDRNFAARAGSRAIVLVVQAPGDKDSARAVLEIRAALSEISTIGNLPHDELTVAYTAALALAEVVRAKRAAIVYFGPGFSSEIPAIRDAFSSLNVLTFGSVPEYIPEGVVLGVDLVSGRPKLSVNVSQARKQQVLFSASVLNLMKLYP